MEGLRAKARRLLRELLKSIVPKVNLDRQIYKFVDAIINAAVEEARRQIEGWS